MSYDEGLSEIGDGIFAYLQPDGSWGWSNAGLVTSAGASLLVDTLFDLSSTRTMLDAMAAIAPGGIDTVVNTHANGDHCWGNQLVSEAEIIASRRGAEEMTELSPRMVATLTRVARLVSRVGWPAKLLTRGLGKLGLRQLGAVGEAADFVSDIFGDFDFGGITLTPPTRTFDGQLDLTIGDRRVELIEVGPAHTRGDVLVHLPDDRVVFTGDILFHGGHPIAWEGPVQNWIDACDRIGAMDVDCVVPGHGPLADKGVVAAQKRYFEILTTEARQRFDAGVAAEDAALDIDLDEFSDWGEPERIAVNVATLYRDFSGASERVDPVELFALMARFRRARAAR